MSVLEFLVLNANTAQVVTASTKTMELRVMMESVRTGNVSVFLTPALLSDGNVKVARMAVEEARDPVETAANVRTALMEIAWTKPT